MVKNSIVHVYKSRDETFFVFKGTIFNDIESIKEYIKKNYNSSDIHFIEMDELLETCYIIKNE